VDVSPPGFGLHQKESRLSTFQRDIGDIHVLSSVGVDILVYELVTNGSRWDFVSWSTKLAILQELGNRYYGSEDDAQMVVDSPGFPYIWEIIGSSEPLVRCLWCKILYTLAWHKCTIPHILEMRGCERLVALLE
jgi:hypothetical protein